MSYITSNTKLFLEFHLFTYILWWELSIPRSVSPVLIWTTSIASFQSDTTQWALFIGGIPENPEEILSSIRSFPHSRTVYLLVRKHQFSQSMIASRTGFFLSNVYLLPQTTLVFSTEVEAVRAQMQWILRSQDFSLECIFPHRHCSYTYRLPEKANQRMTNCTTIIESWRDQ